MIKKGLALGAVMAIMVAMPASAVLFVESSGNLAASADFQLSGTTLTIVLTNTTTADTGANADLLSGVFWDLGGSSSIISADSVFLHNGSTMTQDGATSPGNVFVDLTAAFGGDVSGEFGYATNIQSGFSGAFNGADFGINSSGLGPFGSTSVIGSTNLDGPVSPNGGNFGIAGAGTVSLSPNFPFIINTAANTGGSVIMTLTVATGFSLDDIGNVGFQYGTSICEPFLNGDNCAPIPEPASLTLLGMGLVGLVAFRRKRIIF